MTEITYSVAVDRLVYCQNCGALIGAYVQGFNGRIALELSSIRLYDGDGFCRLCGAEWHWHSSEKKLEDIINRCKNRV